MIPNKKNIRKLVKALRSDKYKQGIGVLKTEDNEFCCLGLAADISKLGRWSSRTCESINGGDTYLPGPFRCLTYIVGSVRAKGDLPKKITEYFGFNHREIDLKPDKPKIKRLIKKLNLNPVRDVSAAYLNDSGATFKEIADVLEEAFL